MPNQQVKSGALQAIEATPPVYILDEPGSSNCNTRIRELIAACGGTLHPIDHLSGHWTRGNHYGHVLLVQAKSQPEKRTPCQEIIDDFKKKGFNILAFGDGVLRWSVSERCRLLLAGASAVLDSASPGFERDLCTLVKQFLREEATQENESSRIKQTMAQFGVVGASQSMITLFRAVLRISVLSDLPVLLTGETGTGKDVLARAIHTLDPKRCKGPLIVLNCAAVIPTLAESELFGHERGAFTGANRSRKGLIRSAEGGVLFLDEIGELDLALQSKLLRVLQESRVLTLGSEKEVAVSFRIVAATNRDLAELTRQGKFRQDLFHRLNVLPLHVPPLRERIEDVEPLVRFFVTKHAHAPNDLTIDDDYFAALQQVDLPGNVRQLENLVRQSLANKTTSLPLGLKDLPLETWQQLCKQHVRQAFNRIPEGLNNCDNIPRPEVSHKDIGTPWGQILQAHGANLSRCLETCERELLGAMLRQTKWNQSDAARALGVTPRTVYNKLRKYEILP